MTIYCLTEMAGLPKSAFYVEAGDLDQARRLIRLNCHIPAGDAKRYSCEVEGLITVPYGFIYSSTTGETISVTIR
jgi:hypothetical protein